MPNNESLTACAALAEQIRAAIKARGKYIATESAKDCEAANNALHALDLPAILAALQAAGGKPAAAGASPAPRVYTVLLAYPDGGDEGNETYMTALEADNAAEAGRLAQEEAFEFADCGADSAQDFTILMVIAGDHDDITGRADL